MKLTILIDTYTYYIASKFHFDTLVSFDLNGEKLSFLSVNSDPESSIPYLFLFYTIFYYTFYAMNWVVVNVMSYETPNSRLNKQWIIICASRLCYKDFVKNLSNLWLWFMRYNEKHFTVRNRKTRNISKLRTILCVYCSI